MPDVDNFIKKNYKMNDTKYIILKNNLNYN